MEKTKTSPFLLTLLAVAIIVGGGLLGFGFMKKSETGKDQASYSNLSGQLKRMESMQGYPNEENVAKLKSALVSYKGKVEGLKNSLQTPAQEAFKNIPSARFATKLEKATQDIKALYESKEITLPENWYMGFEKYTTVPAPKNATGILAYELDALTWLHKTVANHNPMEIINIYRDPVEDVLANEAPSQEELFNSLQIQLSFVGYESDVRGVLNDLIKTNEFLFTVDTIKLKLLKPLVPKKKDDKESVAKQQNVNYDKFFGEEDESESAGDIMANFNSDEKLFNQALGQERVAAFLNLNLIYASSNLELPNITKN